MSSNHKSKRINKKNHKSKEKKEKLNQVENE